MHSPETKYACGEEWIGNTARDTPPVTADPTECGYADKQTSCSSRATGAQLPHKHLRCHTHWPWTWATMAAAAMIPSLTPVHGATTTDDGGVYVTLTSCPYSDSNTQEVEKKNREG